MRIYKLSSQFIEQRQREQRAIIARCDHKQKAFLNEINDIVRGDNSVEHHYYDSFINGIRSAKYSSPSAFINSKLSWIFWEYIPKRFKKHLLYAVDNLTRWQYSRSYYRRSYRISDYAALASKVFRLIYDFNRDMVINADICDILELKLPEAEKAYITYHQNSTTGCGYCSEVIAYELDMGNARLEEILSDIINGESEAVITREIISGITKSRNAKMHDLLCKLLVAARLQEGLRQSICESADVGTTEAFLAILETIDKNDLIRFSSVKRAVGTWTGLLSIEEKDTERISRKTLSLIKECLLDPEARKNHLASEDSMEIYLALWAYAFYEARDALKKAVELVTNGTRHQILTVGYFMHGLEMPSFSHYLAKKVIAAHSEDKDILAVYLPYFMENGSSDYYFYHWHHGQTAKGPLIDDKYFDKYYSGTEEGREYYNILKKIYDSLNKKEIAFSPCVFPWHSAVLSKSDLAVCLCFTAKYTSDQALLDECSFLIKEINIAKRARVLEIMLSKPNTPAQRAAMTELLGDKDSSTVSAAYKIITGIKLSEENYLQMEEMLRYKSANIRASLIDLLYRQGEDALYETIERLLSDKKEEKRTAGLDMVISLSKENRRKSLYEKCLPLVKAMDSPTTKEKILIESIIPTKNDQESEPQPLFDYSDVYAPEIADSAFTKDCADVFMRYFPDSELGHKVCPGIYKKSSVKSPLNMFAAKQECQSRKQAVEDCQSLSRLIARHRTDEFSNSSGTHTLDCNKYEFYVRLPDGNRCLPFSELWTNWYNENIGSPERLMRAYVALAAYENQDARTRVCAKYVDSLFGKGFSEYAPMEYMNIMGNILDDLSSAHVPEEDKNRLAVAAELWFLKAVPASDVVIKYKEPNSDCLLISHVQISMVLGNSYHYKNENAAECFAIDFAVCQKCLSNRRIDKNSDSGYLNRPFSFSAFSYSLHSAVDNDYGFTTDLTNSFISAAYRGIISERTLLCHIFEENHLLESLKTLSFAAVADRENDRQVTFHNVGTGTIYKYRRYIASLVRKTYNEPLDDDDKRLIAYAAEIYNKVINEVLSVELKRGDTATQYSHAIHGIARIYGGERLTAILCALGRDTLERSSYCYYYEGISKRKVLCHLLAACVPEPTDTAESLRQLISGTDITEKRLIEASLYAPEWLDIIGEYLGCEGYKSACYYFMAHMKERFDDRKRAIIAKYTPLEDTELNMGAFDINWFRSAYNTVGAKRFDMIYDAAKYISDGAKHSRARKYADAALGKLKPDETEKAISEKRNKDLLMAYGLIPLSGEDDICRRYLYLQQFLKESRAFGSQRSASEKAAVGIAMQNLATNAGYADVTRLTLRMETKLIDDSRELFEEKEIEDITIKLTVDEAGKADVLAIKGGKALKSIPAKLKKNEYVVLLSETKKKLTEQYRRTRQMFEQAMEESTSFNVSELNTLSDNPVALPIIKNLVFNCGGNLGFLEGSKLIDWAGNVTLLNDDDAIAVAHPFAMYSKGCWQNYQKNLFERRAVQPFKQVFRELYVKTREELELSHSLRYSGNQIQPAKTAACLKSRRWVADVEDGIQKVYYKENIVARIYALADWFSPADIESPTLEWVEFSDRKTGKPLLINEIPDIIFSEVMRDVDLAVSVAHAGGVDPETSHSTVEMRAALLEFTLTLFKFSNVRIEGSHAHIRGRLADYTLNLGSGVIHQKGGAMINILPVHSQHRGKLFLPFADDDPKTAEIITKALFLAEDFKIKDPSILSQIIR